MRKIALLLLLFFTYSLQANTLTQQIDTLIAAKQPEATVGVVVQRLDTGERIVARFDDQPLTPASLTKLLTSYVAFKTLGSDHTFTTQLFYNGDLYIRFSGDPSFSSNDLHALLDALKEKNITKIKGDIIIDDTVYEKPYYARGWTYDSIYWYYSAPISSVILDENYFPVILTPNEKLNKPVKATLGIKTHAATVESDIQTVTPIEAEKTCQLNLSVNENNHMHLYGCWPVSKKNHTLRVGLTNPTIYAGETIKNYLRHHSISFKGEIKTGKIPRKLSPIAEYTSPTLSEHAKGMIQDSNNLYAESYAKTLGGKFYRQANFQTGSYAIQQQLFKLLNIDPKEVILFDGSGNSSYNLATPNAIANVLHAAFHDTTLQPFQNAQAKPGQKGSLQTRMKTLPVDAKFAGKTGTMTHTSALAGTMMNKDRIPLVVVFITNNTPNKAAYNRQVEDELVQLIYNFSFSPPSSPGGTTDSASPS